MTSLLRRAGLLAGALLLHTAAQSQAQSFDPRLYQDMRWRMIGPHRGGRTKAAAGIPDQPNVFYIGVVNGGVWKTTDYGRTWFPIFDDQPTGSIGALALAPSNPDIIYVGSGEGLQRPDLSTGDGIYKSTDAGKTWTHLGLRDGQQIPQIIVDPRNPDRLFVAVLGHPYGPNAERGVFRSLDGGRTFQKVLYKDEDSGAADVIFDPTNPNTIYAVLWQARQGPWENGAFTGPNSGIYKSTDGGDSWQPLTRGLPTFADGLGRIGITVAPSDARRMYATVEVRGQGWLYRSDDAGDSWNRVSNDPRAASRPSDFAEVKVDPTNPDIVYTGSIVTWKSTDGGKTFSAFRGAPGGDDYHRVWINPKNPKIILLASDQGAIITVNGGETFSSWYNQPTAQFYHVITDNAFPYRVCSGQQESGSVCIQSRGDDGQITFREWHPVAVDEYGYVAPDPLNPDIVYGGRITRYDRRTGQSINITPKPVRSSDYRVLRTAPVVFSSADPRLLYFASNTLWLTSNGGQSWKQISPDLTRRDSIVPPSVGVYSNTPQAKTRHPGVIYTLAPSHLKTNIIWVGTDDGLIHVSLNGGQTWQDVTPPELKEKPWSKVSIMDASHFDTLTAYAAINTFRNDDLRPHIYRTRDGGKTWQHIAKGIPDGGIINVVREDPKRRGLLFAGSEQAVYVSFDDGDNWQSLRLNMPATSIRDLVIKDDDVVVGTHGRSFWILDDITPLRQLTPSVANGDAFLFKPQLATRFRWNKNTDTPLPPEEPAGQNPPDGAIINFWLKQNAQSVTLEVLNGSGAVIRKYSSEDPPEKMLEGVNVPPYWVRPPQVLSREAGMHRFVWDLHYPKPAGASQSYPIAAIYRNTVTEPHGPWVMPGTYTVRLTVDGKTYSQPLTVRMDPRVKTPAIALQQQFDLSKAIFDALARSTDALRGRSTAAGSPEAEVARINNELLGLYNIIQDGDIAPTTQTVAATTERLRAHAALMARIR
jgi:photosystem II stability/assembly factor-like uncharacterized protein